MLRRIGRRALVMAALALALALARPAVAQSTDTAAVRERRAVAIAFSPAGPLVKDDSYEESLRTIPLPALRVSVNLSPRLALDFTAGLLRVQFGGAALVDVGARWFYSDALVSPYLAGRAGWYFVDGDENPDRTYRYATVGLGIEQAFDTGVTAWADIGPALVGGKPGVYASLGLGYRFGRKP
jgi:hypothetical protein